MDKTGTFKGREIRKTLVFNPGHGFIPTALSRLCKVDEINLVGRDLEALRASRRNLILNGHDSEKIFLFHDVSFSKFSAGSIDLVQGILDDKEDSNVHIEFIKELSEKLSDRGFIVIASGSTPITRIESFVRKEKILEVVGRHKSKGKSIIVMKHKI